MLLNLRRACSGAITITTICSILLSLVSVAKAEEEATSESELIRRYLASPPMQSELRASALQELAAVAPAALANPELEYRHEEARGPAGATTDAIGAAITVDLGLVSAAEFQAARLRKDAVRPRVRTDLVGAVCELRRELSQLWAAERRAQVVEIGHGRLHELTAVFEAMASAGEVSGYDLDRVALADSSHRVEMASAAGDVAALRARVASSTHGPVTHVELVEPIAPAPLEAILERARAEHPELVALRLQQRAASRDEAAARRQAAPSLRLSGAARFDGLPDGGERTPGFEVGAVVELPVFDHKRREARSAISTAQGWAARVARTEQRVLAAIEAAWWRGTIARGLAEAVVDTEALWSAARSRYAGGEASIDELLQIARDVEEADVATLEADVLARSADLELQCAAGRFDDPRIESAIDEVIW